MIEAIVRELRADDEAALAAFFQENDRPEVTRTFRPFPLNPESARRILHEVRRDRSYGLFESKEMRGFAMLRGWDEGYEVPSFGLLIDHRHQGRGLGARLAEYVLCEARLGSARVRLSVDEDNIPARRIYEALGFVEQRREDPANERVPARLIMVKELA